MKERKRKRKIEREKKRKKTKCKETDAVLKDKMDGNSQQRDGNVTKDRL